jgi:hypothetical protein
MIIFLKVLGQNSQAASQQHANVLGQNSQAASQQHANVL